MERETMLVHLGEESHVMGAVTPPIYQTSLFVHETVESFAGAYDHVAANEGPYAYSRVGNPNLNIVEKKLAALEGTEHCKVFASGMSAITAAIMSVTHAGSHVVLLDTIYGPARNFLTTYLSRFGVETTMVPGESTEEILNAIRPDTKLVYIESPSSLLFQMQDLAAIGSFCRERSITTLIDNTYSGGILQRPAEHGIDLIAHSGTKFFAGHSDACAGVLCGPKALIDNVHREEAQYFGNLLAPFPAWLVMRGLRTLTLRLQRVQENGAALFEFLRQRPEVAELYHAGDPTHPHAAFAAKQMSGFIGLMTFVPKVQDEAKLTKFIEALQYFQLGVSWGGHESLIVAFPYQYRPWGEAPKYIVRLYTGLENANDLLADLDQAFVHLR